MHHQIDDIYFDPLLLKYSGESHSNYHPVMLLTLLIYNYIRKHGIEESMKKKPTLYYSQV